MVKKFEKFHKIRHDVGRAKPFRKLVPGECIFMAVDSCDLDEKQTEAGSVVLRRYVRDRKDAILSVNIPPRYFKTKKSLGTRMGGGKGSLDRKVAPIKKGTVIFIVKFDQPLQEKKHFFSVMRVVASKLPLKKYRVICSE